jgi:hypothetical protein
MNRTGLDFSSGNCRSPVNRSSSIPATSSMSVIALLNAVSESYPYDKTLVVMPASCSWRGRKSFSQFFPETPAVHVCFQWPPRPWTATMLLSLSSLGKVSRRRLTQLHVFHRRDSREGGKDRFALLQPGDKHYHRPIWKARLSIYWRLCIFGRFLCFRWGTWGHTNFLPPTKNKSHSRGLLNPELPDC